MIHTSAHCGLYNKIYIPYNNPIKKPTTAQAAIGSVSFPCFPAISFRFPAAIFNLYRQSPKSAKQPDSQAKANGDFAANFIAHEYNAHSLHRTIPHHPNSYIGLLSQILYLCLNGIYFPNIRTSFPLTLLLPPKPAPLAVSPSLRLPSFC